MLSPLKVSFTILFCGLFSRVVNYYSVNDPLMFLVPSASRALRTGVWGGGGANLGGQLSSIKEPEYVFLTPRGGDPIIDHGLFGPTYIDALRWEGKRYQMLYLPVWYPWVRFVATWMNVTTETAFDILKEFMKCTIIPWILFVQNTNSWMMNQLILPLIMAIQFILEIIKEFVSIWKDRESRFENVRSMSAISQDEKI